MEGCPKTSVLQFCRKKIASWFGSSTRAGHGHSIASENVALGTASRKTSPFTWLLSLIWLVTIVAVMVLIINFSNTPGLAGTTPIQWPAESHLPLDPHLPTLVMFAHPHCPCTRASLGELELLMAHCQGKLAARVVFVRPAGMTDDWVKTDSWNSAAAIPGVTVSVDDNSVECQRFQAETSGDTVLYDTQGHLLFQGGITISRGHSGDNPGRSALEALLTPASTPSTQITGLVKTPVFGCTLYDANCQQGGGEWKP